MADTTGTAVPERFGRFLLLEQIGRGGMAEVFRATAQGVKGFQRVFVIKRILKEKSASQEFIEMFVNEARICALLNHPNIVQIYDFGQLEGSYFLSMEYLRGKDLLTLMRELNRRKVLLPPEVAAYIAQQVASGLHHAHTLAHGGRRLNIVHRDVSPSNIMLLRAGGVKILDFGIAKAATEVRGSSTTLVGVLKGKLSYLAPEQVQNEELDGRADIFSLGVVLWECLTGKRLFYDRVDYQTMRNVIERPVPPPSTQRIEVPPALDYIVVRALERELSRRYPSAQVMADELDAYLQDARFSPSVLPRFLDEIFGPDTAEAHGGLSSEVRSEGALPAHDADLPDLPVPGPGEPAAAGGSLGAVPLAVSSEGSTPSVAIPIEVGGPPAGDEGPSRGGSDNVPPVTLPAHADRSGGRRQVEPARIVRRRRVVLGLATLGAVLAVGAAGLAVRTVVQLMQSPLPPESVAGPALPPRGNVSLHVTSDPPGAEITRGDLILGVTPAVVLLPRGQAPVELIVRKAGFVPARYTFTPSRDLAALIALRPARADKLGGKESEKETSRATGKAGDPSPRTPRASTGPVSANAPDNHGSWQEPEPAIAEEKEVPEGASTGDGTPDEPTSVNE